MKHTTILGMALCLLVATGCGGSDAPSGPVDPGNGSPTTPGSSVSRAPTAGGNYLNVGSFPLNEMAQGANADAIPALTDPSFVSPGSAEASYLRDDHIVMGVVLNGEARAYPQNIGWWHEIVNDVVGGTPIIVSFCPLTGTGMVFDGTGDDGVRVRTGVSGLLFNSNLVMYDRRDGQTLYPQMTHTAVVGPNTNEVMELLPVVETTWGNWKKLYPATQVIGSNTGVYSAAQYQEYPYVESGADYRVVDQYLLFPFDTSEASAFFGAKEMTLGVRFGEMAKAYPFSSLGTESVINDAISGNAIAVVYHRQGAMAVPFSRTITVDNQPVTLTMDKVTSTDSRFPFLMKDKESDTVWDLTGAAISGPHSGKRLTQIPAHNAFWIAWTTFWKNTGIY